MGKRFPFSNNILKHSNSIFSFMVNRKLSSVIKVDRPDFHGLRRAVRTSTFFDSEFPAALGLLAG